MNKKLIALVTGLLVIMMFPMQALAVRYDYVNDPFDDVTILAVNTTETTAVVTVGDSYMEYYNLFTSSYFGFNDLGPIYLVQSPAGYGNRQFSSYTIMSNLNPATTYRLRDQAYDREDLIFWHIGGSVPIIKYITTEATTPSSPMFSNSTETGTYVNWHRNNNGDQATFYVERAIDKDGPWITIYSGAGTTFSDVGLVTDQTYYYRIGAKVEGGTMKYSSVVPFTPTADPAVAAAQAAQSAAEVAMIASEQAKTATQETKTEVQELRTQFTEFMQADTVKPEIHEFAYAIPKATITTSSVAPYTLIVTDNRAGLLQYRYKLNNGEYSEWVDLTSETVNIELGSAGLKRITAQVKDQAGNIATKTATIFKM